MAATVRAYCATGAGPTLATCDSADSASIKYGRDDSQTSTTSIPIPTATGTKYSYLKYLCLDVTVIGATSISNRRIAWASSPATGLTGYFLDQATYTQNNGTQGASAGNYPADAGTNGATPAGYTAMTTSNQVWDNTSHSTGSTGRNGDYAQTALGVDNTFIGGGGAAALPNLLLTYDEA
jgi:hypothetical protein